ncbi:hypothetical protein ABI59_03440 [Acidobacteria bacterium Mor1]|nr:hypothetical protein ABI59_03440 [Acidobacteria bacterium Mor1]
MSSKKLCIAIPLLALALAGPVCAADPFPYHLAVDVAFDRAGGPDTLRQTVLSDLLLKLRADGCYSDVSPYKEAEPADLLLRVVLSQYEEHVEHDLSLGASVQADEPQNRNQFTAIFTVRVGLDFRLAGDPGESIRSNRIAVRTQARPRGLSEDESMMRERVRDEGIFDLVRSAARHVCRGSQKKLDKQVAQARERAGSR